MLVVECIHSSYIYIFFSDKKNGNKQIRIAVVVVPDLFWCWWWLFAWFYSPLFITKLRNTLRIILCHSTRVWIHQEESTNLFQKGAFYGGRELYKCFFFALGNCLCGNSFLLLVNCTIENAQTLTHFRHYQFILVNGFWYFNNILSRV